MAGNLVVGRDILEWADERKERLLKTYERFILVGGDILPKRSIDKEVAIFCKENNCDLPTGDTEAYLHYFEAKIPALRIFQYDWDIKGDRPILIQILD
jgi:hypothetical protein